MDSTAVNKSAILFVILGMFFVAQLACTRLDPAADPNPTPAPPAQAELVDCQSRYPQQPATSASRKSLSNNATQKGSRDTTESSYQTEPDARYVRRHAMNSQQERRAPGEERPGREAAQ